jgi:hypothetical protein
VHKKRNEEVILYKEYNDKDYPKYDNYDAINVDKVKDIPCDWLGHIGVPATFLSQYNPNQFEIIGALISGPLGQELGALKMQQVRPNGKTTLEYGALINKKAKFARIIIKNKQL